MPNNSSYTRPSWDEYFLKIIELVGLRSSCDRGRSGCVITKDKRIISTGYIGSPIGLPHCDEIGHEMHTVINPDGTESRHCIRTTHAEQNAICQAARFGVSLEEATIYCKMTPCYVCAKMIINAGIKRVVASQDYHAGKRSKEIFAEAGVQFDLVNSAMTFYPDQGPNKKDNLINMENKNSPATFADIFLYDEFNPEDNAMLQALYSRSPKSVTEHVEKVRQSGSGKFMEQFYVGYGHASIADCGSTTFFIEKLSIIADKAIQDWPLYSGQETSTRYVDMSKQPIIDPLSTDQSKEIYKSWMDFYINSQERLKQHLAEKYPRQPAEDEKIYIKAIAARTFDIMRGFLPAGITTQLSWHTNLRQAHDKLDLMRHNPLEEIRLIAETMLAKLKEKYPHSFGHKVIPEQENYRESICQKYNFYNPATAPTDFSMRTNISELELWQYGDIINLRALKTGLPHFLNELGNVTFEFLLDYGSFRDIQRHRNGVCRIPLLTTKLGFNQWYLDQLPDDIKNQALALIEKQKQAIENLNTSPEISQYYIPLGFNITCKVTYGLPAAVYVLELRSMKSVHPTLRLIAHKMYNALQEKFPNLKMYADLEKDDWDVRRGLQDIIKK